MKLPAISFNRSSLLARQTARNEIMDFHSRKLVFLRRPEDVTVELSEWH